MLYCFHLAQGWERAPGGLKGCPAAAGRGPGSSQTPGGCGGSSKASGSRLRGSLWKRHWPSPACRGESGVARPVDEVHLHPGSGSPGSQRWGSVRAEPRAWLSSSPGPRQLPRHPECHPCRGRASARPGRGRGHLWFGVLERHWAPSPSPRPVLRAAPPSRAPAPLETREVGVGGRDAGCPGLTGLHLGGVMLPDLGARGCSQ